MNFLRDADDRVRSFWVILVFVVTSGLAIFLVSAVTAIAGLDWYGPLDSPRVIFATLPTLLGGIAGTAFTWKLFKEPTGLDEPFRLRQLLLGGALGAAALTVSCVVPALLGITTLTLSDRPVLLAGLTQLVTLAPAGLGEELLLRGIGFQALRRGVGDVAAVVLSSALFGLLHITNPHASWVAALLITLVGLWFGAAMVRSGSVWLPMGLHVAWNFFEGFVFGQPVSGNVAGSSLFVATFPAEPGFWSGGAFGPEAAGWTGVVLVLALGLTLGFVRRRSLT